MKSLSLPRVAVILVACWAVGSWLVFAPRGAEGDAKPIKASNVVELRDQVGREVTVHGTVGSTGVSSRSGHQFLNFANSELTAVCFAPDVAKFTEGKPADVFKGKRVELTGKLEVYRGKLQIKLGTPEQIKVVDFPAPPPGTLSRPAKVELKKIGEDTWLSPAGLVYKGRDPQGLTRVEHVLRHARDIPRRDGPHGVFDGGPDAAFGWIDEAWLLAQKKGLQPEVEEGRSLYLVPMGRRVGFLGGRTGATRGHPPLDRIFIVVDEGSKNVITAFPR
jgi:hypothetical protein